MGDASAPLLEWSPPQTDRHGETFSRELDFGRLNRQQRAVFEAMRCGGWFTLAELSAETGAPEASVSARIRDFRKPEMSNLFIAVERRRRGEATRGLWEYRVRIAAPSTG